MKRILASVVFLLAFQQWPLAAREPAIILQARGDYYYNSGDSATALGQYQRALQVDPDLIECHFKLGTIFFDQGQYNFAEYHFTQLVTKRKHLTYSQLYLDTLLELVHTYYKMSETIDPGADTNIHLVKLQDRLKEIIAAFEPGKGEFADSHANKYLQIEKDYYLGRAWYTLARIFWDKNRDQEYPGFFLKAAKHFRILRSKQVRAENTIRVAQREAECLFFLRKHHIRLGEITKANNCLKLAENLADELSREARKLHANPTTAWSPDIAVYNRGAQLIKSIFDGKIRIEPMFQFFKPKQ